MLNKAFVVGLCLSLAITVAPPSHVAMAQEKTAVKDGFAFPKDKKVRIVAFRPDVDVGEQSTGGVHEPRPEWTETARGLLGNALKANLAGKNAEISFPNDPDGEDGILLERYRSLFNAVVGSVIIHKLFPGNRLPTKKEKFDWSLGPGVKELSRISNADYALFIYTQDSYGSGGRKAAQVVGLLFGAYIPSGVHIGYAGLVDLNNGEVVWVNADAQMGGDVRTEEGATKRVGQLLEGFPTDKPAVAADVNKAK